MKADNYFSENLLRNTYHDPSFENVESLINYLLTIGGKELKLALVRQLLFKVKWQEKELKLLHKCHVQAAAIYLKYLLLSKKEVGEDEVKIVIADISKCIEVLDPGQNASFIVLSTNTLSSAVHYKQAESIFYTHSLPIERGGNYDFDLLVLYALRLSLEKRIHGFLGIDVILNHSKPISLSKLIKIAKRLQKIEYSSAVNWNEIEWINNWLNHFMHRHLRPYPWIIHQAFEVLNAILLPSEHKKGTRTIYSLYAATVVEDYEELKKELESKLIQEFKDVKIIWSFEQEIIKGK